MSDKESEDGRDKEEEEEDEEPLKYAPAISALPPRVIQQEESQVEVSASPAFQCLEEVQLCAELNLFSSCILCYHLIHFISDSLSTVTSVKIVTLYLTSFCCLL